MSRQIDSERSPQAVQALLGKRLRALRSARGLRQEAIALVTTLIAGQDKAALKKLQIFIKEMLGQTAQADQGGERAS